MSNIKPYTGIPLLISNIQEMVAEAGTGKRKLGAFRDPEPNTFSCGEKYFVEKDLTDDQRKHIFSMIDEHVAALKDRVFSTGPSIKRATLTPEEQEAIIRDVIVPEIESHKPYWPGAGDGSAVERMANYSEMKTCHVFCDPDGDAESIIAGCLESECSGGEIDEDAIRDVIAAEKREAEFARRRAEKEVVSQELADKKISAGEALAKIIELSRIELSKVEAAEAAEIAVATTTRLHNYIDDNSCCVTFDIDADLDSIVAQVRQSECSGGEIDEAAVVEFSEIISEPLDPGSLSAEEKSKKEARFLEGLFEKFISTAGNSSKGFSILGRSAKASED
jgi:hypothetical protein